MKWVRLIGLLLAAVVAGVAGWFASERHHLQATTVPRVYTDRAIEEELAEAARIGIDSVVLAREVPLERGSDHASLNWSMPVAIGERECVALIVGAYGSGVIEVASLDEMGASLVWQRPLRRLAAQVQWCSLHATTVIAQVTAQRRAYLPPGTPNALIVRVARGSWDRVGGPGALTRGIPTESALGRLATSYPEDARATHAVVPDGSTPIAAAWTIPMGTALLVPGSQRTYATLYRANARDAGVPVNPRVDTAALPDAGGLDAGTRSRPRHVLDASIPTDASVAYGAPDGAPWYSTDYRVTLGGAVSTPLHDPVVDLGRNDFRRVLAVVDPPGVRDGCITVVFHRSIPLFSAAVSAFDLRTWRIRSVTTHAGNTASDELCPPSHEPVVYVVPDSDQAEYMLEILGSPGG